jgi:hypothetical protein
MGTDEPPPPERDGRPDCVEDPLEKMVRVTTCTATTGVGVSGGCCGGMTKVTEEKWGGRSGRGGRERGTRL